MKAAIIENEFYNELDLPFTLYKTLCNADFSYDVFQKSQEIQDIKKLAGYDLAFIDLDLSFQSEKDGFGVIKDILDNAVLRSDQLFVITALKENLENELAQRGLPNIKAIFKPITYKLLENSLAELVAKDKKKKLNK